MGRAATPRPLGGDRPRARRLADRGRRTGRRLRGLRGAAGRAPDAAGMSNLDLARARRPGRPRRARGARRGLPAALALRRDQPRARGSGGGAVREPPERRRRHDEEPRRARGGEARPRGVPLQRGARAGRRAQEPVAGARADARVGPAHEPGVAALRRHRRGAGGGARLAREARRVRVRDRRGRGEGRRLRAAAGARLHVEVPALGDRLQVPGRPGRDGRAGDRGVRGPHRTLDTGREPRARLPLRDHGEPGDAPQRRGDRAQGRARR